MTHPDEGVQAARDLIRDSTQSPDPEVRALAAKMLKNVKKDEKKEAKGKKVDRP